ncbi:MAG: hypothetical protein ACREBQ_07785, partial [Nitrososphaerales archaeon]
KKKYRIDPRVSIKRAIDSGTFRFKDIFHGFEYLDAVKDTFGRKTNQVLDELKVEVFSQKGYMGVSDDDGHIFASKFYLNEGKYWSVYLDAVHELVHVRQFKEGRNLFDSAYSYADRPTEIEAYRVTVEEARRIGLDEQEIFAYLEVPWMAKAEHLRLAKACNVAQSIVPKEKSRPKSPGRKR